MKPFQKILVPMDASGLDDTALDAACNLANQHGSRIFVMWVRPEPKVDAMHVEPELAEVESEISILLADARRRVSKLGLDPERVQAHIRAGSPADAICIAADELGADLIVMGTHGRHGIGDWIAGSTTERVVRRTPAAVLVVKPVGFPDHVEAQR